MTNPAPHEAAKRIDGEMSDLFFNHEHPQRNDLYAKCGGKNTTPTEEQERAACLEDAKEFVRSYPNVVDFLGSPTPEDLVNDFMARL